MKELRRTQAYILIPLALLFLASLACQAAGSLFGATPVSRGNVQLQITAQPQAQPQAKPQATIAPGEAQAPPPAGAAPPPAGATQPLPGVIQSAPDYKPCLEEICIVEGTFLLGRPIGGQGRIEVDPSWRFAEIRRRRSQLNVGTEFLNSSGTPVVAAAPGKVVVAGDDTQVSYSDRLNEYGNLVVLEHTFAGVDKKVYTLYAHLSEIDVKKGDEVQAGQTIGKVGMSGNTRGSTLHFEVRLGKNDLDNVRNPALWLQPLPDENGKPLGALAGRVVDQGDNLLPVRNFVIERLGEGGKGVVETIYLRPYMDLRLGDKPPWRESFAINDLTPGMYQISIWRNGLIQKQFEVKPNMLTLVEFRL